MRASVGLVAVLLTSLGAATVAEPASHPACAIPRFHAANVDCNDVAWATGVSGAHLDEAIHPDGSLLYVARVVGDPARYHVEARHAATGALSWTAEYSAAVAGYDYAWGLAVSPLGDRVFVTGGSQSSLDVASFDAATLALDARTGQRLWVARYDAGRYDEAFAVAASPDGARVFVAGWSEGGSPADFLIVAYDAETGAQLWAQRDPGSRTDHNLARALAVSPDGARVFATGWIARPPREDLADWDLATSAYDAATGEVAWSARYDGPDHRQDTGGDVAVSPDGTRVYVVGDAISQFRYHVATLAYDAATGAQAWVRLFSDRGHSHAARIVPSHDGGRVYVSADTGAPAGAAQQGIVLAYEGDGDEVWRLRRSGDGRAPSIALSPDDARVYLAGTRVDRTQVGPVGYAPTGVDLAAEAYSTSTGAMLWSAAYNGEGNANDASRAFLLSPDGAWGYHFGAGVVVAYDATGS